MPKKKKGSFFPILVPKQVIEEIVKAVIKEIKLGKIELEKS